VAGLNQTTDHELGVLHGMPHGRALASIVVQFTEWATRLMYGLAMKCVWPGVPTASTGAAYCQTVGDCYAPALRELVLRLNVALQSSARGVVKHLCRAGSPAAILALVAAIDGAATQYPSVTTECVQLGSALERWAELTREGGPESSLAGSCWALHDMGVSCAHSLFQAAHLSATAFVDLSRALEAAPHAGDWAFVGAWGSDRAAILSGLLEAVAARHPARGAPASVDLAAEPGGVASDDAPGGDQGSQSTMPPRELRAAEVGVHQANTSEALLRRFPSLRLLLVDPYHLHGTPPEGVQLIEEFYVSPRRTFDMAVEWLRPFRARATFALQASVEAAAWVARGSLDLVFIDGDHRRESVAQDIEAWWPRIREGGVLAGHDFAITYPGVVQAAMDFAFTMGLQLFLAPEIWWFNKPSGGSKATSPTVRLAPTSGAGTARRAAALRREGVCYL